MPCKNALVFIALFIIMVLQCYLNIAGKGLILPGKTGLVFCECI